MACVRIASIRRGGFVFVQRLCGMFISYCLFFLSEMDAVQDELIIRILVCLHYVEPFKKMPYPLIDPVFDEIDFFPVHFRCQAPYLI
jgi:hypothetical protein